MADMFFDDDEMIEVEMITLTDDDGEEFEFQIIERVEVDGEEYAILAPEGTDFEEEEDVDVVIIRFDADDAATVVDDEDIIEEVFEEYGRMHEDEYDIEIEYEDDDDDDDEYED